MAEMNCGTSGKDPGVTGQCCKKGCPGQIPVQARPQGQACGRPSCPAPVSGGMVCGISGMYPAPGNSCGSRPAAGPGCGMCPGMNPGLDPSRQALMRQIREASFAMDEALLFLDTHPDCAQAMEYYRSAVSARKAAMDAYQSQFGPLLVDDVMGGTWTWVTEKWPWEGGY